MSQSPSHDQLILQRSAAANARWARCSNRSEATEPARRGFDARLARDYGIPDDLPPAEHAARMANARKAYFQTLSLKASTARRKAKKLTVEAEAVDQQLAALGGDVE